MPKVVYWNQVPEDLFEIVTSSAPVGWDVVQLSTTTTSPVGELSDADYLIVADRPVTREMVAAAPALKMVQHQGVGYERVDLEALNERGIELCLTPEGTTKGVAEHVFALVLSLNRHLRRAEEGLREGNWMQWTLRSTSFEINRKQMGIVGFGRIGQEVARLALAFGAVPVFVDPFLPTDYSFPGAARMQTLEDLLSTSDIVSLHVPSDPAGKPLITNRELSLMSPDSILINTARGSLVDYDALVDALTHSRIRGAGLDVFPREPVDSGDPLVTLENVVLTPHIAAGTRDAFAEKMRAVFANLQRKANGEETTHSVDSSPVASREGASR